MTTNRPTDHEPARRPRHGRLLRGTAVSVAALWLGVLAVAVPAAQASQRPAARTGTAYPYTFSRIARTEEEQVIAATDQHGDLYLFWKDFASTTWHKHLVAAGGSGVAYSAPSIASIGAFVVIAALDASGDLLYFSLVPGTIGETREVVATAAAAGGQFQAPSITTGSQEVLISAGNTSGGALLTYTQPFNGGPSWTEQTLGFGGFGPSSIITCYDSLSSANLGLVTAASGGTLYFWWEFLSTPNWNLETIASTGASYTGGSVAASASNVLVTAATTTGTVDFFGQPIGSSTWTQQAVSSSGGPYASPQIAWTGLVNGVSYDVITAANNAGAVHYWWSFDGSTTFWHPETIAAEGLQASYANPGVSVTSNSVVITAINTEPGNVMYWYQLFDTNPWHRQVVAKG